MSLQTNYDWDGLATADIVAVDTETSLPACFQMMEHESRVWLALGRAVALPCPSIKARAISQ